MKYLDWPPAWDIQQRNETKSKRQHFGKLKIASYQKSLSKRFESTKLCPELMAAASWVLDTISEKSNIPPRYNISMIQLLGIFPAPRRGYDNTHDVRKSVYESNAKLLALQGIPSKLVEKRPTDTSGLLPVNFWKMDVIQEECNTGRDLVWLLDSDIVLKENIAIDVLWAFHYHHFDKQLDILLAKDWNGLFTGSMVINCQSQTTKQFLQEWKALAIQIWTSSVKTVPWHGSYVEPSHELEALRCLLYDPTQNSNLPYDIRSCNNSVNNKNQENMLFKVRTTYSCCALVTYPRDLYNEILNLTQHQIHWERDGSPWWEPGHQAIHVSSEIPKEKRNLYLNDAIPPSLNHIILISSLKQSAEHYLNHHYNLSSAYKPI
jgi:hypothetical protein